METPSLPIPADLHMDAGVLDTKAVVGQVDSHLADLSQIPKDPTGLGVIMAVVAVAGGGTAWKFYNDHSKRKHEQEMARIEKSEQSHQQCAASRATLEAKISTLEATVNELKAKNEKLSMEASGAPSVSDLSDRLEELEKALKQKKSKR